MNTPQALLPAGFEALESFVAAWAVASAADRAQCRLHSTTAERAAFHAVASALLHSGLEHLDGKPPAQFDAQEQRLMQLLLSLCHVALAVEMQGDDEQAHASNRRYLTITRAVADE